MLSRRRRLRDEAGFTLIELLVTISILTVVMITLTAMVFEYMRQTNETSTRINESSDQQFVSAYWQLDVSSIGIHGFAKNAAVPLPEQQSVWSGADVPGCSAPNPVVTLGWNTYPTGSTNVDGAWTGATPNYAVYYTTSSGSQTVLHRKRCGDANTDITLARYLAAPPGLPTCLNSAGATVLCSSTNPLPAALSLKITVQDKGASVHTATGRSAGYSTILTAERRQG